VRTGSAQGAGIDMAAIQQNAMPAEKYHPGIIVNSFCRVKL
jgi:hypothetical protein